MRPPVAAMMQETMTTGVIFASKCDAPCPDTEKPAAGMAETPGGSLSREREKALPSVASPGGGRPEGQQVKQETVKEPISGYR